MQAQFKQNQRRTWLAILFTIPLFASVSIGPLFTLASRAYIHSTSAQDLGQLAQLWTLQRMRRHFFYRLNRSPPLRMLRDSQKKQGWTCFYHLVLFYCGIPREEFGRHETWTYSNHEMFWSLGPGLIQDPCAVLLGYTKWFTVIAHFSCLFPGTLMSKNTSSLNYLSKSASTG